LHDLPGGRCDEVLTVARIVSTKGRKPAKLTRAELRRNELDAILEEAMLRETRVPGGTRRERISTQGQPNGAQVNDRRRNGKRRKGEKLTPFDIAWAIQRWIAGETQKQIAKSLGYAGGSNVSTEIGLFVIRNLPKGAHEKYGPSAMHGRLSARKELARLALEAYRERHRAA
jgi:hypothetical protein